MPARFQLPSLFSIRSIPPHWRRRLLGGALALGLVWLLGWLALPAWLRPFLERQASEALGRTVQIEALRIHPWALTLEADGLRIATADGVGTQFALDRLYIDAELVSLLRLAPVVDEVRIERPELHLGTNADGRLDIQDILDRLAARPASPDTGPARLALYNIQLTEGHLRLADGPRGQTHEVTDLRVNVPFISTLGDPRDVRVQPHLSFLLDGSRFDTQVSTQPFSDPLDTEARLTFDHLDLTPYLTLWPAGQAIQPAAAVLSGQLRLNFSQKPAPRVQLTGQLNAQGVRVDDASHQPVFELGHLQAALDDVRPLEGVVHLGDVSLGQPRLHVRRDASGRLNLLPTSAARPASTPPAASAGDMPPVDLRVARIQIEDGNVSWQDGATPDARRQPARLDLAALQGEVGNARFPLPTDPAATTTLTLSARLVHGRTEAPLKLGGRLGQDGLQADLDLQGLDLEGLTPYVSTLLRPRLSGQVDLQAQARWAPASAPGQPDALTLTLQRLTAQRLGLADGRTTLASLQRLELADVVLQPGSQTLDVGRVALTRPVIQATRSAEGRWMLDDWQVTPTPSTESPASAGTASAPWRWQLADFSLIGGQLTWLDQQPQQAVNLQARDLQVQVRSLKSDGSTPAQVELGLKLGSGNTEPGSLAWKGQLRLGSDGLPTQVQGQLTARRLPAHAAAPYGADALNLTLGRADAGFSGRLDYQATPDGLRLGVQGDVTLEDLRADTRPDGHAPADELLRWKTLSLQGLDLQVAPGQPPRLAVAGGALSDFFARVVVQENGRFNLQDLVRAPANSAVPQASAPGTPASAAQAAPTPAPERWRVSVGPFSLIHGRVAFADRFIKPNYQADLSELTGRIGGFSSESPSGAPPQMADLELLGRAEGTASLAITGKVNPLAQPLALDIEGKVRDLELSPLSPYSVKYTGHGIQRGKLSVDVAYTIKPDGQLTARNQLVLNQLTFGDAVPGAPASLPVRLATALLADRQGVIDLNLPISGSLNDPEFSLVPVFFKILGNLVVKAITAPFALLANALGGDAEQLSNVTFVPGTATLTPDAADKLTRVARLLTDKPTLTLTITGSADLDTERLAYQKARLLAQIRAERRRQQPDAPAHDANPLTPDEHLRWLTALYKRADMPKPRNALGLLKDIAPADMETLLLTQIPVSQPDIDALAVQRGVAVRDHLAQLNLPVQRLYLGSPKPGGATPTPDPQGPSAHLQLTLP